MLAQTFKQQKTINPAGWYCSIKLDGQRAFWDGGISRGKLKTEIPWANNAKDERYKEKQFATGLWSRLSNIIHAPDWWLDKLPNMMLDGELYIDRCMFQPTREITSTIKPGPGWQDITYRVFELPPPQVVFCSGMINNKPNFVKYIDNAACMKLVEGLPKVIVNRFRDTLKLMEKLKTLENNVLKFHEQKQLAGFRAKAIEQIEEMLVEECKLDGEGLMLRDPDSHWLPKRGKSLLKVKNFEEDSAVVEGFQAGEEGRTGKYVGMLGALIVKWDGKTFKLGTGFGDKDRHLLDAESMAFAIANPGKELPHPLRAKSFNRGDVVRFKYRELTDDGIPKEARIWL